MPLLQRKRQILAKIETTYGTDAAPAAATDAVLLRSLTVTPLAIDYDERTLIRPNLGGFAQVVGSKHVQLEIELEMAGYKTLGTPTAGYDALLRACGLAAVTTAGTDVAYNPISAAFESATIYYEKDGVLQKVTGCRGTLTLDMQVGKIPSYKLTLMGRYAPLADQSITAPDTSKYLKPLAVNSANTTGLSILGFAGGMLRSLSLDLGHTVVMTTYVGDAETVSITDRSVTGKVSIEATKVAAHDWLADALNVTTGAFSITHGPAGNQVKLAAPNVQLTNPTESDDNGIAFLDFDLRLLPTDAANDELTITVQ